MKYCKKIPCLVSSEFENAKGLFATPFLSNLEQK